MEKLAFLAEEGGIVLLVGMGTVFFFLVILVIAMHIMGGIVGWINKIFPEIKPQEAQKVTVKTSEQEAIAAAIAAIRARNY